MKERVKKILCLMGIHSYPRGYKLGTYDKQTQSIHATCKWCEHEGVICKHGNLI